LAGLVVDILVMYLWKGFFRIIRFAVSIRWMRKSVTDFRSEALDPYWGCPSVRIRYSGGTDRGDEVPFLLRWRARRYAEQLTLRKSIIVRVSPLDATQTTFFEFDQ
jgi:hypothetical protein